MRTRFGGRLALLALGAFALRIAYVLTIGRRNPTGGDPLYYHVQANLLARGRGFAEPFTWLREHRVVPSAVHPPLFTLLLAASSALGGTGFLAHKVAATLAGTATVVVVGLVGRRVGGEQVGLLAAALAALHPNLWVIDGILMPEGLFALTIAVALLAAYRFRDRPSWATAVLLGAAVGVASLARGEAVLLLALLVAPLALRATGTGALGRAGLLVVAVLATALVVAPWTIRNLRTFRSPVLLSVNSDEVLANANCDLAWHGPLLGFWALQCAVGRPSGDEAQRAVFWRHEGLRYVRAHERRLPVVLAARVGRVFDAWRPFQNTHLSTIEGRDLGVNRAGLAMYWALVPFGVAGLVALRRGRVPVWPLLAQVALVVGVAVYAYGAVRFRVPAEVALVVLAAAGIDALARGLRARRRA